MSVGVMTFIGPMPICNNRQIHSLNRTATGLVIKSSFDQINQVTHCIIAGISIKDTGTNILTGI